jgi:hypothetical protein
MARIDPRTEKVTAFISVEGEWVNEVIYASGYVAVHSRSGASDHVLSVIHPDSNR